ncbi:hypothetical protein [Comamonas fluminis]|nr:hypothetical protein [Comamonas fluminis]
MTSLSTRILYEGAEELSQPLGLSPEQTQKKGYPAAIRIQTIAA